MMRKFRLIIDNKIDVVFVDVNGCFFNWEIMGEELVLGLLFFIRLRCIGLSVLIGDLFLSFENY